jgi:DUF1365 family protein
MSSANRPPRARIGFGQVRHRRLAPVEHAFAYPTCFLLLPMRALRREADPVLARNRRALFGFRDADHGDGRSDSLAWLDELLAAEGIADADGEAWLHCIPRMLGVAFKPVSFWYAHRADGTLAAIVVEVNNTFGERHCYLLAGDGVAFGRTLAATKVFHVSPFCPTRGEYAFRFMRTDLAARDDCGRTLVRIELHVDGAPLLLTSVGGRIEPLTRAAMRLALWTLPAMTAVIVARIHWHALKLWFKKLAIVRKPAPPPAFVTRGAARPDIHQREDAARSAPASPDAASASHPA